MSTPLTDRERYWGMGYALVEFFLLPSLLRMANSFLQLPGWTLNAIAFTINFLCLCLIFHRFLLGCLQTAFRHVGKTLLFTLVGLLAHYAATGLITYGILTLYPDYVNLNDNSVAASLADGGIWFAVATVFFVPVSEELLFRGLLFRGLYSRSAFLAWSVSTAAFAGIHILGYIGLYDTPMLLVAFLQYIPAGLCLAFAYRKSDTILAPILMHTVINLIAITVVL